MADPKYVTLEDFKDMIRRYEAFKKEKGRDPNFVRIKGSEYAIPNPVFKDMIERYNQFLKENGREPKVIYLNKEERPKNEKKEADGWVLTGYFKQDFQDTGYTCGPSSLQMALSALGCNISEKELAKAGYTNIHGTTHDGMISAVKYASKKCKKNIQAQFKPFYSLGWDSIVKHIQNGGEIVIHLITRPGLDVDVNGVVVWRQAWGHYVYLVGVNQKKGLVRIADPTKGIHDFRSGQVVQAMNNVSAPSILMLNVKK